MAEGLLRSDGGDGFDVFSAGTEPAGLNPLAVRAMLEMGIDISAQRSKSVSEYAGREFNYVITVCDRAKDNCPVFPGRAERIHWSFEDPAAAGGDDEERLQVFRRVRDEIRESLREFVYKVGAVEA